MFSTSYKQGVIILIKLTIFLGLAFVPVESWRAKAVVSTNRIELTGAAVLARRWKTFWCLFTARSKIAFRAHAKVWILSDGLKIVYFNLELGAAYFASSAIVAFSMYSTNRRIPFLATVQTDSISQVSFRAMAQKSSSIEIINRISTIRSREAGLAGTFAVFYTGLSISAIARRAWSADIGTISVDARSPGICWTGVVLFGAFVDISALHAISYDISTKQMKYKIPYKPFGQPLHMNEPGRLIQSTPGWHGCCSHSLRSIHVGFSLSDESL